MCLIASLQSNVYITCLSYALGWSGNCSQEKTVTYMLASLIIVIIIRHIYIYIEREIHEYMHIHVYYPYIYIYISDKESPRRAVVKHRPSV